MSDELNLSPNGFMVVPRHNAKALVLDLRDIYEAESRGHELTTVNILKAPLLLYTFSRALTNTKQAIAHINAAAARPCQRAIDSRTAVISLDEAKDILEKKGLSSARTPGGSADLRKVVIDADPEIGRLRDVLDQVEAAVAMLEIKAKDFERLYFSVQKVVDPRARDSRNTHGDTGTNDVGVEDVPPPPRHAIVEEQEESPALDLSGFGETKY